MAAASAGLGLATARALAQDGVRVAICGRDGAVVAFLCSDQARFITGAAVPVDGGAHRGLQ